MTNRSRRPSPGTAGRRSVAGMAARHRASVLLAALIVPAALLGACGSAATPSPAASAPSSPAASSGPSVEPSTSLSPSSSPSAAASPSPAAPSPSVGQTETEWGRIWDALPASFPVYPGSDTTEIGHPYTDQRIVAGGVDEVTTWYQAALETAGYSTEAASGPFEDGGMVIDSVGESPECRIQTRIAPVGELVTISIMFGAACPFS